MPAKKIVAPSKPALRRAAARKAPLAAGRKPLPKKIETAAVPSPDKKPPKQRVRLVRDSFTMPEADFALIAMLKARTLAAKRATKKSELLRAGLHVLATLDAARLISALEQLEPVKIGRPRKAR